MADLKFLGVDEARERAPVVDWAGFRVVVQLDFNILSILFVRHITFLTVL